MERKTQVYEVEEIVRKFFGNSIKLSIIEPYYEFPDCSKNDDVYRLFFDLQSITLDELVKLELELPSDLEIGTISSAWHGLRIEIKYV